MDSDKWQNVWKKNAKEEKVIKELLDVSKTGTLEDFRRTFNTFVQRSQKEFKAERAQSTLCDYKDLALIFLSAKGKEKARVHMVLSQNFISRVAVRCMESRYWEQLVYLITTGQLMTRLYPTFAPLLVEHKQLVSIR